ncbi:hypothetical protein BC829DRAFT_413196 [Chytridium lagenaria]|nr:hypothetical protein BC829DRAFT_413196 [Chytridium lagenaria]
MSTFSIQNLFKENTHLPPFNPPKKSKITQPTTTDNPPKPSNDVKKPIQPSNDVKKPIQPIKPSKDVKKPIQPSKDVKKPIQPSYNARSQQTLRPFNTVGQNNNRVILTGSSCDHTSSSSSPSQDDSTSSTHNNTTNIPGPNTTGARITMMHGRQTTTTQRPRLITRAHPMITVVVVVQRVQEGRGIKNNCGLDMNMNMVVGL